MVKVGIVGCGTIGSELAKYCSKELRGWCVIASLYDAEERNSRSLKAALAVKAEVIDSLDGLAAVSDLIVEAASGDAAADVLAKAVELKKDALIISVGGVIGREDLLKKAGEAGCRIYFPSGAVAGIDAVKAASIAGIERITLTTRKPAAGLKGAPHIEKAGIDIEAVNGEEVIFEGSAREAIKAFPKNVNVSAALSLAGAGPEKTRVRVVTSPLYDKNVHEVELSGAFGSLFMRSENVLSPGNPRTSYLAVLSACAALRDAVFTVRVGT